MQISTKSEPPLPVTAGINEDDKLYLSQGMWSISRDKDNKLSVTKAIGTAIPKCGPTDPEVYKTITAQMNKLAKDVCSETTDVRVQREADSPSITQRHMNQFCKGIGSGRVVEVAPNVAP